MISQSLELFGLHGVLSNFHVSAYGGLDLPPKVKALAKCESQSSQYNLTRYPSRCPKLYLELWNIPKQCFKIVTDVEGFF